MSEEIRILIIDDDTGFCQNIADTLFEKGYSAEYTHTRAGALTKIKDDLFKRVEEIYKELGVTILLAEQDISFAFSLSKRNYVMSRGHIIAEGTAEELLKDETIRKTYLGL